MLWLLWSLWACFEDADRDGYNVREDCDDTNPGVHPGALEVCDGIDDDCDGVSDEDGSADALVFYADGDADGYGDDQTTTEACELPEGYVEDASDCDDATASTNPAATEVCDGVDQDCDGIVDLGCVLLGEVSSTDAPMRLVGAAEDRLGAALGGIGDLDGDGLDELVVGAWGHTDSSDYQGALYVFSGTEEAGAARVGGASLLALHPDNDTYLGASLAVVDVDGDGATDVFVGAPALDERGNDNGGAYLLLGPLTAAQDLDEARNVLLGEDLRGMLGDAVAASSADDGVWLVAGAPRVDTNQGRISVWLDLAAGEEETTATISGEVNGLALGTSVAVGDLDGDGLTDVVAGGPGDAGGSVVRFAAPSGALLASDADQLFSTEEGLDESLGEAVTIAGDLDGDGLADLVMGAPRAEDGAGAAYVWAGPWTGDGVVADAQAVLSAPAKEGLGERLAPGGDADGDGFAELLIGAPRDNDQSGAAWLVHGPLTGVVDPDTHFAVTASDSGRLGDGLAAIGDRNGDGVDDVAFGAPSWPDNDAGRVFMWLGGTE